MGDMCHHCKGDTWQPHTTCMEGTPCGRPADREDDVAAWKIQIGHLAPRYWLLVSLQKFWSPLVLNLRPRHGWMAWQGRASQPARGCFL
jgi:hypothetical protein